MSVIKRLEQEAVGLPHVSIRSKGCPSPNRGRITINRTYLKNTLSAVSSHNIREVRTLQVMIIDAFLSDYLT